MPIDAVGKKASSGKKRADPETPEAAERGPTAAKPDPVATPPGPPGGADEEAAVRAPDEEVVFEVCQEQVVIVELPRIDDYVEDLIDPEFGLAPARETTRAAAKKMLGGFNEILREMVASAPPKRRDP